MKLSVIADIIRGAIMTRYCDETGEGEKLRVLSTKSIRNSKIYHDQLTSSYWVKGDESQKVFTREGDIVIKLAQPYDSALIKKEDEGLFVPSSIAIIRCRDSKMTNYLLAILNHKETINKLVEDQGGMLTPTIRINVLADYELPDLEDGKKMMIGELFAKSQNEMAILEEMSVNQTKIVEEIIGKTIRGEKQ